MKKIIRKTEKEREQTEALTEVKVSDTGMFYLLCERCNQAFFDDDIVLKISTGGYKCPLEYKHLFCFKTCHERIYGGDERSFNEHYKLAE